MSQKKVERLVIIGVIVITCLVCLYITVSSKLERQVFELERERFDLEMQLLEERSQHNLDNLTNKSTIASYAKLVAQLIHVELSEEEVGYVESAYREFAASPDAQYADTRFFGAAYYYMLQHESDVPPEFIPEAFQ